MRLAVDARPLRHPFTGIGKYTEKILCELSISSEIELLLYGELREPLDHREIRAALRRPLPGNRTLATAQAGWSMARWATADRADLFWSPRHHLPLGLRSIPSVVTIHDLVWRQAGHTMPVANRVNERLQMPRSLRSASAIIVPSEFTRQDLAAHYPDVKDKLHVVPLGGDLNATPSHSGEPQDFVLFVGGVQHRKNLRVVLEALALLKTRRYVVNLLVVGDHPPPDHELARLINQSGLGPQIEFRSGLSESELATLYRDCRFLVAPYLWEGFGLPVAEAAAFGKPAVVSQESALSEIAGQGGWPVDCLDIEAVAGAIRTLSEDQERYAQLSRDAAAQASGRTWSKTAGKTLAVFQETLKACSGNE